MTLGAAICLTLCAASCAHKSSSTALAKHVFHAMSADNTAATQEKGWSVDCEGTYGGHLQGVATDGEKAIYWSHTVSLVKTDWDGKILAQVTVPTHHGDLTYHNGKVYVAVNLGKFNQEAGQADSWVYVYDANELKLLSKHPVQEVVHGAGGMAYHNGRFVIVGGLPEGYRENYAYEYDAEFKFIRRHTIESGYTRLGIQTVSYYNKSWWFGCYGSPKNPGLLQTDLAFQLTRKSETNFSYGIIGLSPDVFLRGECFEKSRRGRLTATEMKTPKSER